MIYVFNIRRYVLDLENWIEVVMIILTTVILLRPDQTKVNPSQNRRAPFLFLFFLYPHLSSLVESFSR